jgi:hypothetical protein
MTLYKAWNGPMPTTASQATVATGTAIKTMLQIAAPATRQLTIISWGYTVNTNSAGGGIVELIETDVAATVTAHVAAGVQPLTPGAPASLVTLSTTATGYTATAEGSTTASRVFDVVDLVADNAAPSLKHAYQFMPDERPVVAVSRFLRVRANTANTVNMHAWVVWSEQ